MKIEIQAPSDKNSNVKELTNDLRLAGMLDENIADLHQFSGNSFDLNIRQINLPVGNGIAAAVLFVNGLTDKQEINNSIIRSVLDPKSYQSGCEKSNSNSSGNNIDRNQLLQQIFAGSIISGSTVKSGLWIEILDKLFSGQVILLIDGATDAIIIDARKFKDRGITEATTEQVVHGPKDSFNETLIVNTSLIRRRLKTEKLRLEKINIGSLSKTDIVIAYIQGIANPKIINEVRDRITRIETDTIESASALQEYITDSVFSIFPTLIDTERPDRVVAHLTDGGVSVFIENTPFVIMMPYTFWQLFYSAEDYYEKPVISSFLRNLRLISFFLAIAMTPFYVSVATFQHEMIPIVLLEIIVQGRANVPFPILIEVLIMEGILEIIREAGLRLPRSTGQAISIVGALVLGQAAIQAKLASPATVTVVAISAVANFSIPSYSAGLSIRLTRFFFILISGFLGVYGFITGIYLLLIHLCSIRSFGIPYMAPMAPRMAGDFKDSLIRAPRWAFLRRPQYMGALDSVRQKSGQKPKPPEKQTGKNTADANNESEKNKNGKQEE